MKFQLEPFFEQSNISLLGPAFLISMPITQLLLKNTLIELLKQLIIGSIVKTIRQEINRAVLIYVITGNMFRFRKS